MAKVAIETVGAALFENTAAVGERGEPGTLWANTKGFGKALWNAADDLSRASSPIHMFLPSNQVYIENDELVGASVGEIVATLGTLGISSRGKVAERASTAARSTKFVDSIVPGVFGRASVGTGQVVRILQAGGNKILKRTADALNDALGRSLGRREWGRALERLKREIALPNDHHGRILSDGAYVDDAGNVLGNLLDYVP